MTQTNTPQGPAAIFQMLNAAQVSAILCSAIDLKLFANLTGCSETADAVAKKISCPARTTRILLDALGVVGLVSKSGDKYQLSQLAEEHLVPGKQMYVGDMSGILGHPNMWNGLSHLTEAVRSGGSVMQEHAETPSYSFWTAFAQSSGSMAMGASMALQEMLADWVKARGKVRVLDVAAGSGIYGFTLAQKFPNVELTTLDWPNVIAEAKTWAQKLNIDSSRVKYIEGNLFDVEFGGPYDLVIMSQIYHHFDPPTCLALTRKVAKALTPDGRVAVQDFLFDGKNHAATMFSITMLVSTHKGEAYSEQDYRSWLAESGFKNIDVRPNVGMPTSFIFADKV